jgi:hypothetical protein
MTKAKRKKPISILNYLSPEHAVLWKKKTAALNRRFVEETAKPKRRVA